MMDKETQAVLRLKEGVNMSRMLYDAPLMITYSEWENEGVQCRIIYPVYKGRQTSMWDLIPQKLMPPTRWTRYCCEILKETSGKKWKSGEDVMEWWTDPEYIPGQLKLADVMEGDEA